VNSNGEEAARRQSAFAVSTLEIKFGGTGRYSMNIEHDRIEPVRSWAVYHASSNVPVHASHAAIGEGQSQARKDMVSFNLLSIGYRKEWLRLSDAARSACEIQPVQPWR